MIKKQRYAIVSFTKLTALITEKNILVIFEATELITRFTQKIFNAN
jgi:hypothetical protein